MNQTPIQQFIALSNIIIDGVSGLLVVVVLGIQIELLVLPAYTRDKRFNQ